MICSIWVITCLQSPSPTGTKACSIRSVSSSALASSVRRSNSCLRWTVGDPLGKRSPTCWAIAYGTVVARSKKWLFHALILSGSWKILNSGNLTRKMWHTTRHSVAAAALCIREPICVVQMVPALPKHQVCDQRSHSFDLTTDLGGRIIEYFTAFGTWRVQLSCWKTRCQDGQFMFIS